MSPEDGVSRPPRKRDPSIDLTLCGHYPTAAGKPKHNRAGGLCAQRVVDGTTACRNHGGRPLKELKAKGAVVVELRKWGLTGAELVDPGETLLRLVSQSAARCELYARLLGEAYDAARLRAAESMPEHDALAAESARLDLERVLNHGGVGALIGNTYAADKQAGIFATGEAIRGLAKLEADERERCANFATKAVAAGLAERMVRQAEQVGAVMARLLPAILADPRLGLDQDRLAVVDAVMTDHLRALAAPVIDGPVAA
jgi:hypothetical protein